MADNRVKGCVALVLVGVIFGLVLAAVGVYALVQLPETLLESVVEQQATARSYPVTEVPRDDVVRGAVDTLQATRTVRFSGPELTTLLVNTWPGRAKGGVVINGDVLAVDASVRVDDADLDGWVNVQASGHVTMRDGRFERLALDQLTVGQWDLDAYLVGSSPEELAARANAELEANAAKEPEVLEKLDKVELLTIAEGHLVLTVTEDGTDLLAPPTGG